MDYREGERALKVFHHHPTPFIFWFLEIIIAILICFLPLYFFQKLIPFSVFLVLNLVFFLFFSLIVFYKSVVYWLDKLIVTNQRIVHVNWVNLFKRKESEAMLNDIQDIKTSEKGLISYIPFLDYGTFALETASAKTTILFEQAPDPEGIRQYIYHVRSL
ncbi:MAG: hypothetical protein RBS56_03865 [Candidatus Gracilibacteria bacterium]|jgi:hypothetical protein|nr:hypothetical protein [Candidatus Gracilibacteria bacterium]